MNSSVETGITCLEFGKSSRLGKIIVGSTELEIKPHLGVFCSSLQCASAGHGAEAREALKEHLV